MNDHVNTAQHTRRSPRSCGAPDASYLPAQPGRVPSSGRTVPGRCRCVLKNARMRRRASCADASWYPDPGMNLPRAANRTGALSPAPSWSLRNSCPALRVLLYVVLDPRSRQCLLQPGRCSPQRPVPAAVASDNGACPGEETGGAGILRSGAVVDARYREPAIRREHQGQPAAHAIADHADLASAVLPVLQPGTRSLDVGEHPATPGARIAHDRDHAPHRPPAMKQVRRHGQVPLPDQPTGLVPQVQSSHSGSGGAPLRRGQHRTYRCRSLSAFQRPGTTA